MRETSLDEFLGEGDADSGSSESNADADSAETDGPSDGDAGGDADRRPDAGGAAASGVTEAVDPAIPTYDWTPEGAACEACEAVVERRWRGDEGLVCADCKAW